MTKSPKCVLMVRDYDAASVMVDQLSTAIEQIQFQQNYTKLMITKPNWYTAYEYSGRQKTLIEKLRGDDERLQSVITGGKFHANWNQYNAIRKGIKEIFSNFLRHEMKFSRQNNIEQHIWKLLYHNFIESARRLVGDRSNNDIATKDSYRQLCLHLIADGTEFFQDILSLLTQTYGFQLEQFMGVESGKNLKGLKYISLAVVSAQKCCTCLGDLLRYQILVTESTIFVEATEWYTKAYQLIPSNGMPSNQLAILALYNKKKFDAIFYHMRSLNASNPINSAKESLLILFDELRKKYQSLNKIQSQSIAIGGKNDAAKTVRMKNFKREIWVHPTDGQLNYRTVFLDQESESLDSSDLYKKFIFNFSHVHGILFTKVGSDSLEICMEQTLKQFQELLNHNTLTSCIFTIQKMAQMIILNIYSIENSMQLSSSSHSPSSSTSSQPQSALVFSFAFIGIILNKLQCEMDDMLATADTIYDSKSRINGETHFNVRQINKFKLSDSINNSLAAISLWCNWLKFNWSVWTTDAILFAVHKFNEVHGICIWDDFARLTMALDKFNFEIDDQLSVRSESLPQKNTSKNNNNKSYKRIRLTEDMITLGMSFVIRNDFVYCKADIDEQCALTILRWKNIYGFCTTELMKEGCSFLCRLDFGEVVVVQLFSTAAESGSLDNGHGFAEDEKDTTEYPANDKKIPKQSDAKHLDLDQQTNEHQSNASSDEIQKLLQRKNELEQNHKMQEKLSKFTRDILRQTNSETICLEIRPKYLLPDTNCFIDFLPAIKQLAQVYPLYHVIVPIVVLNELEGLAKGDENGRNMYDTPTKTSLNAHKALVFLKGVGSNVKCATSKGSFLNSMAFTKESDCINAADSLNDHLNNDDKILMTAINLTKIHSNDAITGSKLISISNLQRKVVLLTNDRNLKLKAITQNIPVRELVDFIKWSGITK